MFALWKHLRALKWRNCRLVQVRALLQILGCEKECVKVILAGESVRDGDGEQVLRMAVRRILA